MSPPFLRRVTLRNYKSIAACQVALGPLTFLVGRNGAGKSNFLDAIRFVGEALFHGSLDVAFRQRGGLPEVRRISGGHPHHFSIKLEFCLPSGQVGYYYFRIGGKPNGSYEIQSEKCHIVDEFFSENHFTVESGEIKAASVPVMPASYPDKLLLIGASGIPEFRPVYEALCRIAVYNLSPRDIAAPHRPDAQDILSRSGDNAASILQKISPEDHGKIREHLSRIVPGVSDFGAKALGNQEIIEFKQAVKGQEYAWTFPAESMSDGTLRAFGVLLAVFQGTANTAGGKAPLFVGLEEPEIALHPAAAGCLLGSLFEGSNTRQIVVSSHSPDLLDDWDIPIESILAVDNVGGTSTIAAINQANVDIIKQGLMTPGELLRQNQLQPDEDIVDKVMSDRQLRLFDMGEG